MQISKFFIVVFCCVGLVAAQTTVPIRSSSTSTLPTSGSVAMPGSAVLPSSGSNVLPPISSPSSQSASLSMMSASLASNVPIAGSLSTAAPSLSDVLPASTMSESSAVESFPAPIGSASISESSAPIPLSESSAILPTVATPPVSQGMTEARIVTSLSSAARSFLRPAPIGQPPHQTDAQAAESEIQTDPQVVTLKTQLQNILDNIAAKRKQIESEKAKIEHDNVEIRERTSEAERLKLLIVKQQKTAIKAKLEEKLRVIQAQLDNVKQQAHGVLGQKSALEDAKTKLQQQIGRYV